MPFSVEEALKNAKIALREGGKVVRRHFGLLSISDATVKGRNDYVTLADRESEERIKSILRKSFPDHAILAEESGTSGESPYVWILDPLDGTTNFIKGFPFISLSIALKREDDLLLGGTYDPLRDEMFWAVKGRGAYLDGKRLQIHEVAGLQGTLLATGFPFREKAFLPEYLEIFKRLFEKTSGIRRAGSAALDLAYVARGVFSGFFEFGLSPWDIAAGALLVKEAGGVITDFEGGEGYLITGNVVAGSPEVHREILKVVKEVLKEKADE